MNAPNKLRYSVIIGGASLFIILALFACQKDNIPPVAIVSAFPLVGDSTMHIEFNGKESSDNSTYLKGLLFSWDFESDGNWDVLNSTNAIITNKFSKPGSYKVCMKVQDNIGLSDYDTISIHITPANTKTGQLLDERDGNSYTTVFLCNHWWMAENLKHGELINSTQEQVNNQTIEKYYYLDDSVGYSGFGGMYKWEEAINYNTNPRGICPEGWHLPDSKEWQSLLNNIDPWYAWQFFGAQGLSGLNINEGKSARREYGQMIWHEESATYWARDYYQLEFLQEKAPYAFFYEKEWGVIGIKYIQVLYDGSDEIYVISSNYASIRCVKDE